MVKGVLGGIGFALVAAGPVLATPPEFPALRACVLVAGGLLVLVALTMRLRLMLVVLASLGLMAGLAATIAGHGDASANRAALALDCAAALAFGAALRRPWAAIPFLLVPLLIVTPSGTGWGPSHQAFAAAWTSSLGCEDCLWPGLPAGLALVGAAFGDLRARPWTPVRPSALPVLMGCAGVVVVTLVLASLLPGGLAFQRTVLLRAALLAGLLGWVGLSYQAGRLDFVWQAGATCLLVLVGALYADANTRYPDSFDATLLITVLASLMPALLAGVGLLVRQWIAVEARVQAPSVAAIHAARTFLQEGAGTRAEHVESTPLHTGGFGPRGRPDEAPMGGQARE